MKQGIGFLLGFVFLTIVSNAQINVTPNATANALAQRLIGSGVNVTNATLNCPPLASGDFTVTSSNIDLDSGIVLTSGLAATSGAFDKGINGSAIVPFPATDHQGPGDPDLTLLCGQVTNDACILEFDFETTGDSVQFNYVFGSSEYQSFTCNQSFNDVFGFFLSGPGVAGPYTGGAINIATVPGSGGTCPVGVSTIYCPDTLNGANANPPNANASCCNGSPSVSCHASTTGCGMFTTPFATCPQFVCNSGGATVTYPGFTTVLTAEAQIIPCTTYHFKIAIADATDGTLDSGVLLEAGSFSANSAGLNLKASINSLGGNPVLIEGCDSLKLDVILDKNGLPTFDTIRFTIQGTALNSIDYNFLTDTLIFSPDPNDTIRTISIFAYQDNIPEGTETIALLLQNFCSTALADSLVIEIIDSLGADFLITNANSAQPNDSVCLGTSFIFAPLTLPLTGVGPLTYEWDFGDGTTSNEISLINQIKNYTNPGVYTVKLTVTDTSGCKDSVLKNVFVDIPAYVELSASPTEICVGGKIQFYDSLAPNTFNWVYDFDDGIVLNKLNNPTHVFDRSGVYDVTLTGEYLICDDETKTVTITVNDYPRIDLGEDRTFCPGLDSALVLSNTANPNQILTWSTGEISPIISVQETGRYWAQTENDGCSAVDSVWVKRECYLNIPNSFTPNGDGRNDYFIPRQLLSSGLIAFDMQIMNRWGEVIFRTDKIDGRGWDGKLGGNNQPIGAYVYQIIATWRNGFTNSFRGNVTLLR